MMLEDRTKLVRLDHGDRVDDGLILRSLKEDLVVLVQGVTPAGADKIMLAVADRLGLRNALELQAGFSTFHRHRERISKYYMTVNRRDEYQFIPPHSEGSSFVNMQLASFYCYENSTDGGETILLNVDGSSSIWSSFKERAVRGSISAKSLTPGQVAQAKILYSLNLPADIVAREDEILGVRQTKIPGLQIADVLTRPRQTYSCILNQKLYVYWDSIASIDFDSADEYLSLLRDAELLKQPAGGLDIRLLDNAFRRRSWHSGIKYKDLFKSKITCKLEAGDLIVQNNQTWTHSVNNWSPRSGVRKVVAAFA